MDRERLEISGKCPGRWPLISRSGTKGFALLEVILALTIFTFGLLAISGMFGVSSQALQSSGNRTKAILLAQEKLEELKNFPYPQLIFTPVEEGEERGSIQLVWSIQKDSPMVGLSLLTVTATWRDVGGEMKRVNLATLRADLAHGGE
jgi:hypothetical protein